jgi:ribokinase
MPGRLISLGSISADFQVRVGERPGAVETLAARDLLRAGGGKAANVALAARRLGCEAVLLGCVGDDDLAAQALHGPRDAGADIGAVRRVRGQPTGLCMVLVPPDGKKTIVATSGANMAFGEDDVEAVQSAVRHCGPEDVLVVDWEISAAAASAATAGARERGMRIVIDPSYPGALQPGDLHGAAAVVPNESEALALAGIRGGGAEAIESAAREIERMGAKVVCVKLDDGGCLLLHEGSAWHQRAAPMDAADTTGAGDAVTAALAVALLEGRPPLQAAAFAVAAGELAVATYGAQPSYATRERLGRRLREARRTLTRWGDDAHPTNGR